MASSRRRIAPFSGESEVESDLEDLEKMNGILEDTELINKISDEDLKKIVFEEDLSKIKIKSKEETQTNEVSQKIDVSPKENDGIQGKEKVDKEILRQTEASFRIEKLPVHEEDFATKWWYSNQNEIVAEDVVKEYNTYLQVLEELEEGKIKLPEGFVGKDIVYDLKGYILKDFTKNGVKLDTATNLAHRAFYAHCTKRALDSLRQGIFVGEDGYQKRHPEVADAVERRINEILFEKLVNKEKVE